MTGESETLYIIGRLFHINGHALAKKKKKKKSYPDTDATIRGLREFVTRYMNRMNKRLTVDITIFHRVDAS